VSIAARRSLRLRTALRIAAFALVYLFVLQSSLSPFATLRMESNASIFGVRCLPMAQDGGTAPAAHGACCDAACLLHAAGAAAPPPSRMTRVEAPARLAEPLRYALVLRSSARALHHGPRPQSQRAPPFV